MAFERYITNKINSSKFTTYLYYVLKYKGNDTIMIKCILCIYVI